MGTALASFRLRALRYGGQDGGQDGGQVRNWWRRCSDAMGEAGDSVSVSRLSFLAGGVDKRGRFMIK